MTFFALRALAIPLAALSLAGAMLGPGKSTGPTASAGDWPMGGQNYAGTRSNPDEKAIGAANVSHLITAWTVKTHGDVSATPAVVNGAVYFPDWGGYFTKINAKTGKVIWSYPVSKYDGIASTVSRTSPAVYGNTVYIGDQNNNASPLVGGDGAHLMAINARTGALRWDTVVDDQYAAMITASPIVYQGVIYVGISSKEQGMTTQPNYPCCSLRGSLVALDARTGRVLWRTYTIPPNGGKPGGYSGGAIWGGTPVIDPRTRTVYVDTGNNYTLPASVTKCEKAGGSAAKCVSPDDRINSVIALDMNTGRIKWSVAAGFYDAWTTACLPPYSHKNCPIDPGPDYDFGSGAQLFTITEPNGRKRLVVGAGEKNGVYWLIDANTGQVIWKTVTGPGGLQGGIMWGTATDGKQIYIAQADDDHVKYKLINGKTIDYGSIAAVDAATGRVIWQIADPKGASDKGALTVANGVLYAGSMSGYMYAIDTSTRKILWSDRGQGSSIAGPAVVGSYVYWGNGYARYGVGTGSTTFYAFKIPEVSRSSAAGA
jgi:polyvinyl alcohol dehydrogenase (cytochrome)